MPDDIQTLLSGNKEEQAMSPAEEQQLQSGMGLPNAKDDGEGNPLEKMDKISKTKEKKESKSGKKFDEDALKEMLMTGENTDGMFTPEEKEEDENGVKLHEEQDEGVKAKLDKTAKPSEKYAKVLMKDIIKNPDNYKVMTSRGELTVAEAIRQGYDPFTKSFDDEKNLDKYKEEQLSRLNDKDREALEQFMDPSQVQLAPADADSLDLPQSSKLRKQPEQPMAPVSPEMAGNPMAMPQGEAGATPPMPQAGQGQPDITSLLGGGM